MAFFAKKNKKALSGILFISFLTFCNFSALFFISYDQKKIKNASFALN